MKRIVCLSILAITLCLVLCSCNFSDMLNEFNYIVGIKKDPEYTEGLEFFEIDDDTKNSFLADCALAIMDVMSNCTCRDEFIAGMAGHGWSVQWEDNRKHR